MRFSDVIAGLTVATLSATAALAQPAPMGAPTPPAARAAAASDTTRDGTIQQSLVNPQGDLVGVLLTDGTIVRFPAHAAVTAPRLRPGTTVHARGVAVAGAGGLTLFDARITEGAATIVDSGQAAPASIQPGAEPAFILVSGPVAHILSNRDGVEDGVLLEDGTVIMVGPGDELSRAGVEIGAQFTATGRGVSFATGRSLDADTIRVGDNAPIAIEHVPPSPPI